MESNNQLLANIAALSQPDNFQKYILGTKSNGQPRALYDVVKDYTQPKKKKKKKHHDQDQINDFRIFLSGGKKKKKKKKKHKKHKNDWHI